LGTSSTRAGTAGTDAVDEIISGYADLQAAQEAFYKDLHAHPELSHHEHRTAQRVARELEKCGLTVQTGIGGTGVAGLLANGDGPTVLLRASSCRRSSPPSAPAPRPWWRRPWPGSGRSKEPAWTPGRTR
jgi:hypothetical protein